VAGPAEAKMEWAIGENELQRLRVGVGQSVQVIFCECGQLDLPFPTPTLNRLPKLARIAHSSPIGWPDKNFKVAVAITSHS
jgi:hypothetical protein